MPVSAVAWIVRPLIEKLLVLFLNVAPFNTISESLPVILTAPVESSPDELTICFANAAFASIAASESDLIFALSVSTSATILSYADVSASSAVAATALPSSFIVTYEAVSSIVFLLVSYVVILLFNASIDFFSALYSVSLPSFSSLSVSYTRLPLLSFTSLPSSSFLT